MLSSPKSLFTAGAGAIGCATCATLVGQENATLAAGVFAGGFDLLKGLAQTAFATGVFAKLTTSDATRAGDPLAAADGLRLLIGDAIGESIKQAGGRGEMASQGAALATAARECWLETVTPQRVEIDAAAVSDIVSRIDTASPQPFGGEPIGEPEEWRELIGKARQRAEQDGRSIDGAFADSIAERLPERFPAVLYALVIEDAAGGEGRGYAMVQLAMLAELKTAIDSRDALPAEIPPEWVEALVGRFAEVVGRHEQRLSKSERSAHVDVLRKLAGGIGTIRGHLHEIKQTLAEQPTTADFERLQQDMQAVLAAVNQDKQLGEDPRQKALPPEVLAKAEKLIELGDKEQRAVGLMALRQHEEANKLIQQVKVELVDEAHRVLTLEGDNWYQAGEFDRAVGPYEQALALRPKDFPSINNMAITLFQCRLGSIHDHLTRGIRFLEQAAKQVTASDPVRWAATQNNLGIAYRKLPRGDRGENLERAIRAYEAALEVRTREAHPVAWAMTQNNLGVAYGDLPRGDLGENLERAIGAYEAALEVYTREAYPVDWAATQNNLGNAYRNLPRGDRGENIERAIGAYEAALEVRTR